MTPEAKNKLILKLLSDIKVMACGEPFEAIQMRLKWRIKFANEKILNKMIEDLKN